MIDDAQNFGQQEQSTGQAENPEDFGIYAGEEANKTELNRKMSKIIADRLRSVNQKRTDAEARAAAAEAERDAIKAQISQGQAPANQQAQGNQSGQYEMTPEIIQNMIRQHTQEAAQKAAKDVEMQSKLISFHSKLNDAASQDAELNDLKTNGNEIGAAHINLLSNMDHIKNMPAVVKQLLKDKGDHAVFMNSSTPSEAIKYINELSNKLNGIQSPAPSEYMPTPELSSSSGSSNFNAVDYINKTGRGRQ